MKSSGKITLRIGTLLFVALWCLPLAAQVARPGGVGNNLQAWLKASDLALTSNVTTPWADASGNGYDGTHSSNMSTGYDVLPGMNYNQFVRIDDDVFTLNVDFASPQIPSTVFIVYRLNADINGPLWGNCTTASTSNARQVLTKTHTTGGIPASHLIPSTNIANNLYLSQASYGQNQVEVGLNNRITTPINSGNALGTDAANVLYIGRSNFNNDYTGANNEELDVAEFIAYSRVLNSTEQIQVASYLALKHGITLETGDYVFSNGQSMWSRTRQAGYEQDIFGIAKDDGSGLLQPKSKSQHGQDVLIVEPTLLSDLTVRDRQALVLGNNGGRMDVAAANNPTIHSSTVLGRAERIERVWKAQKTGQFETNSQSRGFTFSFDATTVLASGFSKKNLLLIVSSDENFQSDVRAYPLDTLGALLRVAGVAINDEDYISIAQSMASLWVKTDVTNNGLNNTNTEISQWTNQLFNGNHLRAGTRGSTTSHPSWRNPTGNDSTFNFHPYIRFNDGPDQHYLHIPTYHGFSTDETSVFMVARRDMNGDPEDEVLFSYAGDGTSNSGNEFHFGRLDALRLIIQEPNGGKPSNSNLSILKNRPVIAAGLGKASNGIELRVDGETETANYNNWDDPFYPGGSLTIGQEQNANFTTNPGSVAWNDDQEYEGDLAEIIVLNKRATPEEKVDIETYLALKYGINLAHNYETEDNGNRVVLWDLNDANADYNNRITGVGNDPRFDWEQDRSESQMGGRKLRITNADVSASHSFLIIGDNDENPDNMTTNNGTTPNITERIWYVRNHQNRVRSVTIRLEKPGNITSTSVGLLINGTPNFSSGGLQSLPGTIINISGTDYIDFTVSFSDAVYFCITDNTDQVFQNNDQGAPTTFEACPGSDVDFFFDNSIGSVDHVRFLTKNNGDTAVLGTVTTGVNGVANRSKINVTVPVNATTGPVQLLDGSTLVYTYPFYLTVHNPDLDIYPSKNPICADDTVLLQGVPSGGSFVAVHPNSNFLINNNTTLDAARIGWLRVHEHVKTVDVRYEYYPHYIGNPSAQCATAVTTIKQLEVRDNRLDQLDFTPIYQRNGLNNYPLLMNRPIVSTVAPNLLDSSFFRHAYPATFSGAYVNSTNGGPPFTFLVDQAPTFNQVTYRYDNGGCIGEAIGDLTVYRPVSIVDLIDTLCADAPAPTVFTRDTTGLNKYNADTSRFSYGYFASTGFISQYRIVVFEWEAEINRVTSVTTQDPNHQQAVSVVNNTAGSEVYSLDPRLLPPGTTEVILSMAYTTVRTTTREERALNGGLITATSSTSRDSVLATDTIIITPRPILSITGLDPSYCVADTTYTLQITPNYVYAPITQILLSMTDSTGAYTLQDTIGVDRVFNPTQLYHTHVPQSNRSLGIDVSYIVDRYGCRDEVTEPTQIIQPLQPFFFVDTAYCSNQAPIQFSGGQLGGQIGGNDEFIVEPWMSASGLFNPRIAGPGYHSATYKYTDIYGCVSEYTDTIYVRTPPNIELYLDNSRTNLTFCFNNPGVDLTYQLINGSSIDTVMYDGRGVIGAVFYPSDPTAGNGTHIIRAVTQDSFGCTGEDNLRVDVISAPAVNIDVAFNNNGTSYTYFDSLTPGAPPVTITIDRAMCANEAPRLMNPSPFYVDGSNITRGQIRGKGIVQRNGVYEYDPSIVTDSLFIPSDSVYLLLDTVVYTYTDSIGCISTDEAVVQINPIPEVALLGLDSAYCLNADSVLAVASPPLTAGTSLSGFYGRGFNQPLTSSVNITRNPTFSPAEAGVGQYPLTYQFIDSITGCFNTAQQMVTIHALPDPQFSGEELQYCSTDPNDYLSSDNHQDTARGTRYYFWSTTHPWGSIISDSSGILTPDPSNGTVPDTVFAGEYTIYYTYVDTNQCANTDSSRIVIHPTPNLVVTGLKPAYCFDGGTQRLTISHEANVSSGSASNFTTSGNELSIELNRDSAGTKDVILTYRDRRGCSDTLRTSIYIHRPPAPQYSGLDSFYCETTDTFLLQGQAVRGVFLGQGIISMGGRNQGFNPDVANKGSNTIIYQDTNVTYYNNNMDTLVCIVDTQALVTVSPLPVPRLLSPTDNSRFCSNDTSVLLVPNVGADSTTHVFLNNFNRIDTQNVFVRMDSFPVGNRIFTDPVYATNYYFNPDSASSQAAFTDYTITHIATNREGCSDTATYVYSVNLYEPAYFKIDSVFCQGDPPAFLTGTPSSNGVFTQNRDTLQIDSINSVVTFYPMVDTAGNGTYITVYDTLTYSYDNGVCLGDTTFIVRTNALPRISFATDNGQDTFCLGGTPDTLRTSPMGGMFTGLGVRSTSTVFDPDLAGAGEHLISYVFEDTSTTCVGTYEATLYVYGMPDVDYQIVGGCEDDSIRFIPSITGVNNIFNNRVIDSLTSIQWLFQPNTIVLGTADSNRVDSITYVYDTSGVFNTQLIVTNRDYCVDTHQVRLVVSPTVRNFPYVQGFETDQGHWFAESNSPTQRLLWEWGRDTTNAGIAADPTNHIWATGLNQAYQASDNAWVYGPCFDISSLQRPMIHFDYWTHTPDQEDGTVIEYQRADGTWTALGKGGRGINWFNSLFIAGQPGGVNVRPIGWSGVQSGWKNGRYKLDEYQGSTKLRLRFAFGAFNIQSTNYFDGFAFDNVWIGDRSRNVLLETTSNIDEPGMTSINAHVYNLVFHTTLNKDVTMMQYHTDEPTATDQFYLNMEAIANLRTFDYNSREAGRGYIDGSFINFASALTDADFEMDMLQDPKFSIEIDGGLQYVANQQTFVLEAVVTALEDMPELNYRIYTTITEDSLEYQNSINYPDQIHAVVRKDDDNDNLIRRSWTIGDTMRVRLVWDHSSDGFINYRAGRFQGVVFIQAKESAYKEVFQVATTRDVSGYYIGVDPSLPDVQNEYNEVQNMVLFPNPAQDYFQVRFDAPLSADYEWKLIDMRGVTVQTGAVTKGTEQFQVDNLQYPSGTYVLLLYNKNVFSERKVIINR